MSVYIANTERFPKSFYIRGCVNQQAEPQRLPTAGQSHWTASPIRSDSRKIRASFSSAFTFAPTRLAWREEAFILRRWRQDELRKACSSVDAAAEPKTKHQILCSRTNLVSYYNTMTDSNSPIWFSANRSVVISNDVASIFVMSINEGLNVLNRKLINEILAAFDFIERTVPADLGAVIIINGGSSKTFSAGVDLEEAIEIPEFWADHYFQLVLRLIECPFACIAALNGHAIAAGFVLACAADIRIGCIDKGFIWMSEVAFGIPPMSEYTSILEGLRLVVSHAIGEQECRRLTLLGEKVSGTAQLGRGLVHQQERSVLLMNQALKEAESIIRSPQRTFGSLKRGLNQQLARNLRATIPGMRPSGQAEDRSELKFEVGRCKI